MPLTKDSFGLSPKVGHRDSAAKIKNLNKIQRFQVVCKNHSKFRYQMGVWYQSTCLRHLQPVWVPMLFNLAYGHCFTINNWKKEKEINQNHAMLMYYWSLTYNYRHTIFQWSLNAKYKLIADSWLILKKYSDLTSSIYPIYFWSLLKGEPPTIKLQFVVVILPSKKEQNKIFY